MKNTKCRVTITRNVLYDAGVLCTGEVGFVFVPLDFRIVTAFSESTSQ